MYAYACACYSDTVCACVCLPACVSSCPTYTIHAYVKHTYIHTYIHTNIHTYIHTQVDSEARLGIFALKDIAKGEELSYNYMFDSFGFRSVYVFVRMSFCV